MRKLILISLIIISLFLYGCGQLGTVGQAGEVLTEEPSFIFSYSPCDDSVNPYNQSELGVKKVTWIDDSTLQISAYVSINCADTIISGDYEITGDTIMLKYNIIPCDPCAECLCAHKLTYEFYNIEKKEYNFELQKKTKDCAGEGEYTSGPVAPEFQYDCCKGLEGFDTNPDLIGKGLLCYDPKKGNPVCDAIGTRSEGWYYSGSEELLRYEDCEEPICIDQCGNGICDAFVCEGSGCPCPETPENCPEDCGEQIIFDSGRGTGQYDRMTYFHYESEIYFTPKYNMLITAIDPDVYYCNGECYFNAVIYDENGNKIVEVNDSGELPVELDGILANKIELNANTQYRIYKHAWTTKSVGIYTAGAKSPNKKENGQYELIYARSQDIDHTDRGPISFKLKGNIIRECTDSDGGIDYYTRGYVESDIKGQPITYDVCYNEIYPDAPVDYLEERYCRDGKLSTSLYICPRGCKDGACIKSTNTIDTNNDGIIETNELLEGINQWISDNIPTSTLLEAINIWISS